MNTWRDRFTEALTLICNEAPPGNLVDTWMSEEDNELQDWIGCSDAPWWMMNISAIDAAIIIANGPIEGCQDRIDYSVPH